MLSCRQVILIGTSQKDVECKTSLLPVAVRLNQMPPKRDEAALQEEEELQLAIALSQSEAEEKERMVGCTFPA